MGLSQEKTRFEAEPGMAECPYRPPQTGLHEERHNRNILRRNGLNTVPRAGHPSLRFGRHEKNTGKTAVSTCSDWLR
jgi:hypothetical protein